VLRLQEVISIVSRSNSNRRGYVLIATCVGMVVMTGIAGVAVDLGRMYIAKSEIQSFADSAAVSAALQLDGTAAGIIRAQAAVTNAATGPNAMKWDMATKTVTTYSVVFAQGMANSPNSLDTSSWSANPANPTNYRFTRVTAGVAVPLTFIHVFYAMLNQGSVNSQNVNVVGIAGQELLQTVPQGLLPFSPIAPDVTNANGHYGFNVGAQYTMRYPPPGQQNAANVCAGDASGSYWKNLPSQDRGYWGSNSAAAIRGEIIYDQQTQPITIGGPVPMVGGQKTTEGSALDQRVSEDSDPNSLTYSLYMGGGMGSGNNRRIVALPINGGAPDFTAIAIGAFLLLPQGTYSAAGVGSYCAEYIGPYVQGSPYAGGGAATPSGFLVRLIQ
jgi:Flp pilus assembly protein TadG